MMDNQNLQNDARHFNKIYWYVVLFSFAILCFMYALIFKTIPKENTHNADMTLAFLFGLLTGTSGVLIITNPQPKKGDQPLPGTSTHQVTYTNTDIPNPDNKENS